MRIFNVFTPEQCKKIIEKLETIGWDDGRLTATGKAAQKKSNTQIPSNRTGFEPVTQALTKALANKDINNYCFTQRIVSLRAAHYSEGDRYETHVDMPAMNGERTDISFTIFLTDADDYEGGELTTEIGGGQVASVKGRVGQGVFYRTGAPHSVNEITRGSRYCLIGWIQSNVKDHEHRELLFDLSRVVGAAESELSEDKLDLLKMTWTRVIRQFMRA